MSGPPPLPAQPLSYHGPEPLRPASPGPRRAFFGALITLAVLCFFYAVASVLNNGGNALIAFDSSHRPRATITLPADFEPAPPPINGEVIGPRGLPADQRASIIQQLKFSGPFVLEHQKVMDRFLCEFGQALLVNGSFTGSLAAPSAIGPYTQDTIETAQWRLEISNDRAMLFAKPSRENIHAVIGLKCDTQAERRGMRWNSRTLQDLIDLMKASGMSITPSQCGAVVKIAQQYVGYGFESDSTRESVRTIFRDFQEEQGAIGFRTADNKRWLVLADGRYIDRSKATAGVNVPAGQVNPVVQITKGQPAGDWRWMAAFGWWSLANTGLGIVPIVIGVRLLNRRSAGVSGLQFWVVLKLAMVLVGLIIVSLLLDSTRRDPGQSVFQVVESRGGLGSWQSVVVQLSFPALAMLILLRAPSIRQCYAEHGIEAPFWTLSYVRAKCQQRLGVSNYRGRMLALCIAIVLMILAVLQAIPASDPLLNETTGSAANGFMLMSILISACLFGALYLGKTAKGAE